MAPYHGRTPVISIDQKQALVDNLQLEITERARKLRAQYALQAQGLRTRLEIRVHRIPAGLRKATIGELLEKHAHKAAGEDGTAVDGKPQMRSPAKIRNPVHATMSPSRQAQGKAAAKRKSDELADKENDLQQAEVSRKRSRPNIPTDAPTAQQGATSKRVVPQSQILSPKSNNSRPLPHSPLKAALGSPLKSNIARPVSPLKSSVTAPTATSHARTTAPKGRGAASGTRVASRQGNAATSTARAKRTGPAVQPPPRLVEAEDDSDRGRNSNASDATSVGTTIVTKVAKSALTAAKKAGLAKKPATTASKAKMAGMNKTKESGGTVRGGRTLRKRD